MHCISVSKQRGIVQLKPHHIVVRQRCGSVFLYVDHAGLMLTTPVAHKTGFDLVKMASELLTGEFMRIMINAQSIDLLPDHAQKIGAALLKKADAADDFQRGLKNDRTTVHSGHRRTGTNGG